MQPEGGNAYLYKTTDLDNINHFPFKTENFRKAMWNVCVISKKFNLLFSHGNTLLKLPSSKRYIMESYWITTKIRLSYLAN